MAGGRERSGVASGRRGKRGDADAANALVGRRGSPAGGESNGRSREDVPVERRRSAHQTSKEPAVGGHAMIDLEFLRGLIGAVDASGIDSIEITRAGTRIRISKTPPSAGSVPVQAVMAAPMAGPGPVPAMSFPTHGTHTPHAPPAPLHLDAHAAASAPPGEAPARSDLLEIKSPMVGTFYRSPAPEAPAYVEVGSHVTRGQTLCILEAMKLMNELESEVEGVVREVLVENAEPVEFGQVLFRIEPVRR